MECSPTPHSQHMCGKIEEAPKMTHSTPTQETQITLSLPLVFPPASQRFQLLI